MLLSIGLIVKNEEKYLDECLNALQPLMKAIESELVIVDTGSTDRTVEIAKKYTDKVYFFEWINDFAAARNYGLEKCIGKWFMYVDADEILLDANELIEFFKNDIYKKYRKASYTIRNIEDINEKQYNDCYAVRLSERNNLYFKGKIHETFSNCDGNRYKLKNTIFKHYGYMGDLYNKKIERNDKYIEILMENNSFDAKIYSYRIGHLLNLDKYNEVIDLAEYAEMKFNHNYIFENRIIYFAIIAFLQLDKYDEAYKWYYKLFERKCNVVEIMFGSYSMLYYAINKNKLNHLSEYVINMLNIYENYKKYWEVNKTRYLYDEKLLSDENLTILFNTIVNKLYENNLYEDEISVLNALYKFKGFNYWGLHHDIQLMKKINDFSRIKDAYDIINNTKREFNFIVDLIYIKMNDIEIYNELSKKLQEVPKATIMMKIINNEDVASKIVEKSSDVLKSVYFSNKLKGKQTIKNTKKILNTKDINNVMGFLLSFDSNFTSTVYEYMINMSEDIENQSDIMFMMQLVYYAIAQHSIDDIEKLLFLFLNLIEFTYEYVFKGGDIQTEELSKFLLPYNCKLALAYAQNKDLKSAIIYVKEALKYGNDCAYIVTPFLKYLQNL